MYKYIFKEVMVPFLIGVVVSTFILLMFQIIRLTEFFIVQGVSFLLISKLLFYMVVSFFPITIPISFLFSVLLTFNRMSTDNEIIALKAAGVSTKQLLIPVSISSILVCLLTFYVSFFDGPWGNKNAMNLIHKIGANKAISRISEGFLNSNIFEKIMFYSKSVDEKSEEMKNVFIYNGTDEKMPFIVRSSKAKLNIDELTKSTKLDLTNGDIVFLNLKGLKYRKASFAEFSDVLYKGEIIGDRNKLPPSMTYKDILSTMNEAKEKGNEKKYNEMMVEYNRRFAVPLACIIFAFLGLGFGNTNKRNVKAGASLISFIVLLSYWILYISLTALGIKGLLNPVLSAWIPNIIFLIISIYLIKKIN